MLSVIFTQAHNILMEQITFKGGIDVNFDINDAVSFKDAHEKHGIHGHVKIMLEHPETKERTLWYEDDNLIPISGMQWILMKMFGLHLDSIHDPAIKYEDIGQDTSTVIPDLNEDGQLKIGKDPKGTGTDGYVKIEDDIPTEHFIQGFMVGNGGSGEDAITTKNTDYSFIRLRNPIPFQQTTVQEGLSPTIAGKYLGVYRQTNNTDQSYYIKKFDDRAHIYHNWWRDGQKWDYLDPIGQDDLGPGARNTPKTNRIETYAQVEMTVDTNNDDCLGYFAHSGNNQTAMINELGLVAFDTVPGQRSQLEQCYNRMIKRLLVLIYDNNRDENAGEETVALARDITTILNNIAKPYRQVNMDNFIAIVSSLSNTPPANIDWVSLQSNLSLLDDHRKPVNIGVEAFYNQNGTFQYETDSFLKLLEEDEFASLTTDEAERIKLITYYTFNSIPLEENWKIIINYRIYAN